MNRIIKFRVWCRGTSDNPNFSKPGWIDIDSFILRKYYPAFQSNDISGISTCEDFVLQQFTGLEDKTGREIYEGDIVTNGKRNWEILWNEGGFFEIKDGEYLWEVYKKVTVIGNIFENPELYKAS